MRRGVLLLLLLVPHAVAAEGSRMITMEEALRRAGEMAPAARAVGFRVERARAEARAMGLWANPEVSLSREESAGTVERFSNLSLAIPLWGRLGQERAAGRSGLAAVVASADQEGVALRAAVRAAFIDLLRAQEQVQGLESGRGRLAELVRVLRAREQEGESSGFDRMRAERALAEVEADRLEARASMASARATLGALVALPSEVLEASGSLAASSALLPLEDARSLALSRGDLRALDAEAEQADHLATAARRRRVPEPTVTAGTKTTETGGDGDSGPVVAIAFALPLFDRGQSARVARSEADLLRARRQALALEVDAEVTAAHAVAAARREAEAAYFGAPDSEEMVRIARAAYETGEMRIFELLDACRTALEVRLRGISLQAEARQAEVALVRAIGQEVGR